MNSNQAILPCLTSDLPGIGGVLKTEPEDFVVEEIPAYEPSGSGEHLFLWIEKRDVSANDLVRHVSRSLRCSPRDIGVAGLKDRRAITRQYVSVPAKLAADLPQIEDDGVGIATGDGDVHPRAAGIGNARDGASIGVIDCQHLRASVVEADGDRLRARGSTDGADVDVQRPFADDARHAPAGGIEVGVSGNVIAPFDSNPVGFAASKTNIGVAVGGGMEGRLSGWLPPNWTWKLEYIHLDLGSLNSALTFLPTTVLPGVVANAAISMRTHFTDNIVRVGLNYQFH